MMQRIIGATLLVILPTLPFSFLPGSASAQDSKKTAIRSPLSPEEALKQFRIAPGLRIELVACEPQIESPVAMAFDENGRLWVVEMRDYPNGPKPGEKPGGRIRILEDRDGDGVFETSSIFADGLLFANGILPWRGGVIVTAAPAIFYLPMGPDGKAGKATVLFEGFAAQNPQLRVSHPNLGIDNWIYVANGLRGGLVKSRRRSDEKPINLSGMDFRFDPVRDRHEATSGMGQYGNTFDDWGRRFVCDNRHHLRHVVLESRYLKRNPYLAVNEVVEDISELKDGPLGSGGKIYPISSNWTTSNLHEGHFTAACSVFIYRGDLLPPEYNGSAFTCDPTGNLVHREILTPHGATFRSKPDRQGVEFLASPDDWFRPVFLSGGPDGALYVVDMYRAVIEHPEFMPPELQKRPDLTLGKDKGRIWRIVPEGGRVKGPRPPGRNPPVKVLLTLLKHPNPWLRAVGQRLLLEQPDRLPVNALNAIERSSTQPLPRLHAAWLLEHFGGLEGEAITQILHDRQPRVREHAALLAEPRLNKQPELRRALIDLAQDADARVRFQAALSLGECESDDVIDALAKIAVLSRDDRWTRMAIASSVPRRAGLLAGRLMKSSAVLDEAESGHVSIVEELFQIVGARLDVSEVEQALQNLANIKTAQQMRWQLAGLNGLTEGMGRRGARLETFVRTLAVKSAADRTAPDLVRWLEGFFAKSAVIAVDEKRQPAERIPAVRLLAHASWPIAKDTLGRLLDDPSQEIRLASVNALSAHTDKAVGQILMKSWRSYMPATRREVLDSMLRSPERVEFLLDELEAKRVKPADIDAPSTRRLLNQPQANLRERARRLLQDNLPADRKLVLARYQASLKMPGDPGRGLDIFKKNCATCHRIAGIGVDVGPDISDTRTKTAAALLVDILNPNQAIDNNSISYLITTKSGKSLTGLIAAETAASITLRRAEAQTDVILRQDIEEIQSTGVSLMPEGLEKSITVNEMADLLAFLKNWRYLGGRVPLGK